MWQIFTKQIRHQALWRWYRDHMLWCHFILSIWNTWHSPSSIVKLRYPAIQLHRSDDTDSLDLFYSAFHSYCRTFPFKLHFSNFPPSAFPHSHESALFSSSAYTIRIFCSHYDLYTDRRLCGRSVAQKPDHWPLLVNTVIKYFTR